jgi:hypothetical protein
MNQRIHDILSFICMIFVIIVLALIITHELERLL